MPRRGAALALCLTLLASRAGADEWDIFDELEAPGSEADETPGADGDADRGDATLGRADPGDADPGEMPISLFAEAPRHRVEMSLIGRGEASSLADPSQPDSGGGLSGAAFDFEFLYGVEARIGDGPVSLFTELAFAASDSGAAAVPSQSEYPDLAFARLVLERLDLRYAMAEGLHLDLGILPLRFGNGLYFNPVDFLARDLADGEASGASSYPAIQLSVLGSALSASLSYIPYNGELLDALSDLMPGAFQQGYDGHGLVARAGGFFLGANAAILGFLKAGGEAGNAYALGMELQSPLGRYANFCVQALVSNGASAYEALPIGSAYLLSERAGSDEEALLDAYLELDLPLSSSLMLRAAYRYRQRGLAAADFGKVVDGLSVDADGFLDLRQDAAIGLSYSPLPFLRHMGVLGLVLPELSRGMSASLLAMSGLADASLGIYASLDYAAGETATISLSAAAALGADDSAFGLVREKASVTLSLELYL